MDQLFNLYNWFPTAVITAAVGLLAFVFRNTLSAYLTGRISSKFDGELAQLKSELSARQDELNTLRDGVLSGFWSRRQQLENRRFEALESLWNYAIAFGDARGSAEMIKHLKLKEISELAETDPRIQETFGIIGGADVIERLQKLRPEKERPFVSPMVWALFSSYTSILMYSLAYFKLIESGVDAHKLLESDHLQKLVSEVLPHQKEFIEKYPDTGPFYVVEEIKQNLLSTIMHELTGDSDISANLGKANAILEISARLRADQQVMNSVAISGDRG